MVGEGREDSKDNDLFFVCGLIDYIARKTKNKRADIVNWLGKDRLQKSMIWQMFIIVTILTGYVKILWKKRRSRMEPLIM